MESTGDYKPALYSYLAIPSIAVFGLNVFATRLPAAIVGVLAVFASYFLALELFKRKDLALLVSFLFALSPWHLQFSRVAIESGVGDAFNLFVVLFWLKSLKKPWYLCLSFAFAALNLYVYQSEKAYTPLLVCMLLLIFWRQIAKYPKKTLTCALVVGFLLVLPMLIFTITNQRSLTRLASVNIFTQTPEILLINVQEQLQDHQQHDILGEIIDNRRFTFAQAVVKNYILHFDPNWLFIKGDATDRHQPNEMGHLYLWDLPFLFIGIYILLFGKFDRKTKLVIFGWFLLAPVPASITNGVPHAIRTLNFLPTHQIFIALGLLSVLVWLHHKLKNQTMFNLSIVVIAGLFLFNVLFYLDQYFNQYNYYTSQDWQYGYTQLIPFIQQNEWKYKKIYVSTEVPLDQSYIFFLFYLQYPPQLYQPIAEKAVHYTHDHAFGKFIFTRFGTDQIKQGSKDDLYVFGYYDVSEKVDIIKTINFYNGTPAIKVAQGGMLK